MAKIRFGGLGGRDEHEIDTDLFVLERGGRSVDLGRRALDLLLCLIRNRDRVVDPEFLRVEVWESAALGRSSIPTCVAELRAALGDDPRDPRFIETVRGRGYRFCAEVRGEPPGKTGLDKQRMPLVGRHREIERLRQIARDVNGSGRSRALLIRGEAGIGKTRLVEEFLHPLADTQATQLVRCPEVEGAPAFWPWTQVLRNALREGSRRSAAFHDVAASLASVFPEIRPESLPSRRSRSAIDRFNLQTHWLQAIRELVDGSPLIIALEDVHRADHDSLALLRRLAAELDDLPLLLVASQRPGPAPPEVSRALALLARDEDVETLDLRPFSPREIEQLLGRLGSASAESRGRWAIALHERTEGNPFYVTQLLRTSDVAGAAEIEPGPLPQNSREILARTLRDLDPSTRDVLSAASVLGREFSIGRLAHILEADALELLQRLAPARDAEIVGERSGKPDRFSFVHVLLRDALYEHMEAGRRRQLHLATARTLRRQGRREDPVDATLIAHHLVRAIPLAEPSEARGAALRAGREAARRFAFTDARTLFRQALEIANEDATTTSTERCAILLELAESQLYCLERKASRDTLCEAAEAARAAGSYELLAACALQFSPDFLSIEVGVHDPLLISLLEEAILQVPAGERALRAKLLARLCQAVQTTQKNERMQALSAEALELAVASDDSVAMVAALSARAETLQAPHLVEVRIATVRDLVSRATQANDKVALLIQQTRLIGGLLELGEIAALDVSIEEYRNTAADTGLPQYLWYPIAYDAVRAAMRGRIEEAEALGQRFVELAQHTDDINVVQTRAAQACVIAIERAETASLVPLARHYIGRQPHYPAWHAALAVLHLQAGMLAEARESLERFDEAGIENIYAQVGGAGTALLAEAAAALGDEPRARLLYEQVSRVRERAVSVGYAIGYIGSFAAYAGLLARSLGRVDEAIDSFELAARLEDRWETPSWRCRSQLELAATLHDLHGRNERSTALLEEVAKTNAALRIPRIERQLARVRAGIFGRA